MTGINGDYQNVVGFPACRFCKELDIGRIAAWVNAAPAPAQPAPVDSEDPCDPLAPIISLECIDEDECGMPSD